MGLALWMLLGTATAGTGDDNSLAAETDDSQLPVVLVSGEQRGPGLWKVVSPSGYNVMWILGEVSPIPRKVKWRSRKFDNLLQHSQELIVDFSGYWAATKED